MNGKNIVPVCGYTPPPNGYICIDGVLLKKYGSFQTKERYTEYRECGFDEILFAGEDKYTGEPFETSRLKKMLDLAAETDLKAIVFDERIVSLTVRAQKSIVSELYGGDEAAFYGYVKNCLASYIAHPAFYGVSILDEPKHFKSGVIAEITSALKRGAAAFGKDCFVMTCFLPCVQDLGLASDAFGAGFANVYEAYGDYAEKMGAAIGYFHYDCYPFGFWEGKNVVCRAFVRNMQTAVKAAQRVGVPFHFTAQSFSSGEQNELRQADFSDLAWQIHLALGFGVKKLYYFTYWRFTTRTGHNFTSAIMNDDGTRNIYDEVQATNLLLQKTARYVYGFEWQKSQLLQGKYTGNGGNECTADILSENIGVIENFRADEPVLFNVLKRGAHGEETALYFLNLGDPYEKRTNRLHIEFKKGAIDTRAAIVRGGEKEEIGMENGVLDLALSAGEAVWILQR